MAIEDMKEYQFKPGREKTGGRKAGTPNQRTSAMQRLEQINPDDPFAPLFDKLLHFIVGPDPDTGKPYHPQVVLASIEKYFERTEGKAAQLNHNVNVQAEPIIVVTKSEEQAQNDAKV